VSLNESYDEFPRIEEAFQERLDESLRPRGPESLYELLPRVASAQGLAVDVGCGEGNDAVRLASEFGFEVLGVDPVRRHVEVAREAAREAGVVDRVSSRVGRAENLPVPDGSAAFIWCKETLMFADLATARSASFDAYSETTASALSIR